MKKNAMRKRLFAGILLLLPMTTLADTEEGEWYGKIASGYLWPGGKAGLIGTTQSVYGGTPAFDMDDGASFSLAAGRRLPNGWRIEGELSLIRASTDAGDVYGLDQRSEDAFRLDGDVESAVLMINGYFDLAAGNDQFDPYLKIGAGLARNESSASLDVRYDSPLWDGTPREGTSLTGHRFPDAWETSFAWSVGLGLQTPLTERLLLALEYGYLDLGEAATGIDPNNDAVLWSGLTGQRFLLGLDYGF